MSDAAENRLTPPLGQPIARVLLVAFVVLHSGLALSAAGAAPLPVTALALLLVCSAAAIIVLVPGYRLPTVPAYGAATAVAAATGVLTALLPHGGWAGYAAWHLGAATFVALALTLRSRIGLAWLLMGAISLECILWSASHGDGPGPGLALVIRQAGTLLIGTLFAVGLGRAARQIQALHAEERARHLDEQRLRAAEQERLTSVDRVLAVAGGALERIGSGIEPSPEEHAGFLALEGRLRDAITASALSSPALVAAADAARRRGVDVVLLSDVPAGRPDRKRRLAAADWMADRLHGVASGRFTGRAVQREEGLRLSAVWDEGADTVVLPSADVAEPPTAAP